MWQNSADVKELASEIVDSANEGPNSDDVYSDLFHFTQSE